MEEITSEEFKELFNELKQSVADARETFTILTNIIEGGIYDSYEFNGIMVPSINKRVKDTIDEAIKTGALEIPKGKRVKDIYLDENGDMQIEIVEDE